MGLCGNVKMVRHQIGNTDKPKINDLVLPLLNMDGPLLR